MRERPSFKTSACLAKSGPRSIRCTAAECQLLILRAALTQVLPLQAKFFEFSKFIVGMLLEAPQLLHSLMEAPIEDTHTALCLPPGDKMYNAMLVSCFAIAHHGVFADAEKVYTAVRGQGIKACDARMIS